MQPPEGRRPGRTAVLAAWFPGLLLLFLGVLSLPAANLTVRTNRLGVTPEIVGINSGHFFPGSNTGDWWRYLGVNGGRVFISPSEIEPTDDLAPVGDGVADAAGFLARRAGVRAAPLSATNIDWARFEGRFENADLYPVNHIRVNAALGELRGLGVDILAQITVSEGRFPITGTNDWPGQWELWQHCYAQAFHLARRFDVRRFQMYNEPDAVTNLTGGEYLLRLQLASDAFQAGVADVNALFGKSLAPLVLAPVNAGNAISDYPALGQLIITNRHRNFLGQWDPAFQLVHKYDYHQYGSPPSDFGIDLAALRADLAADLAPEPAWPPTISEVNTRTGATFDTLVDTLDTPSEYARLGDILVNLADDAINEIYLFKFSQTERTGGTYPVAKNALHYVDSVNAPYQVGGITRGGEVYRLFAKGAAPGRERLSFTATSPATTLDPLLTWDAVARRGWVFSVNNTASSVALSADVTAWGVPTNNLALVEEVSEANYGAGKWLAPVGAARTLAVTQPAYSALLFTVPARPQLPEQVLAATEDATVQDGTNASVNAGSAPALLVRNDPASVHQRAAALVQFRLPAFDRADLEFAVLALQVSTMTSNVTAQAQVHALDATNWSEASVTWSNAPNLRRGVPAGTRITNAVVSGAGLTAHLVGQLVAASTNAAERLIDVTDWIRGGTNAALSFLITQDPRWDTALPDLTPGDPQPDGLRLLSREGGGSLGPRLRLVFAAPAAGPVAVADAYAATEDVPLVIAAPGVLANDTNPSNAPPLRAVLASAPAQGTVVLGTNGGFTYTPAAHYNGQDTFTYRADNGLTSSAPATVTLHIAAVNDAPVAVNDTASTTQGVAVAIAVLANDTDPDGQLLSVAGFTPPSAGAVANPGNGTLVYTPSAGFTGTDAFTYTVTDGLLASAPATVTVTVWPAANPPAPGTNYLPATEATVRGGASAAIDVDEAATGYLMVKYNAAPFDSARKTYFQFDLAGVSADPAAPATFTVGFTDTFPQRVQLWALNQAYPGFNAALTWNTAQANETNSNQLLTNGTFTATPVGASVVLPASGTNAYTFTLPRLGDVLRTNRVTLVLASVNDAANNAGGLRIQRGGAVLGVAALPPPTLRIDRAGASVVLSWPAPSSGFSPYAAPAPGAASPWTRLTNAPTLSNSTYLLSLPLAPGTRFFRLQSP